MRWRDSLAPARMERVALVAPTPSLREVLIVLSPPPAPDPDLGKRPTDSARGVGIPR